jgi:hypothetical protein
MASIINATTSSGVAVSGDTSGVLQLATNGGTTAVTIDTSQNVGIGTTSPSAFGAGYTSLCVNGSTAPIVDLFVGGTRTGSFNATSTYAQVGTVTSVPLLLSTGGTERMRITSAGNVGIGATSPNSKLELYSSQNANVDLLRLNNPDSNGLGTKISFTQGSDIWGETISEYSSGWRMKYGAGSPTGTTAGSAGYHVFFTNNGSASYAERMRINSSGNLLIGTTNNNPVASNAAGVSIFNNGEIHVANTGGSEMECLTSSGAHIYFYTYNGSSRSSAGNISSNGGTTSYNGTSDYRLKENVAPITDALSTISKLKPVTFIWKGDSRNDNGFIAHELQEVLPNAVTGEKDAIDAEGNPIYQGIDPRNIVATLTAAIQEQQALITTLQTQVAALTAKVGN